jgi:hypothetical protein
MTAPRLTATPVCAWTKRHMPHAFFTYRSQLRGSGRLRLWLAASIIISLVSLSMAGGSSGLSRTRSNEPRSGESESTRNPQGAPVSEITGTTFDKTSPVPSFSALFSALLPGETIATFDATCTNPQTSFNLGDTVCAKVMGAPLGPFVQRHFTWVSRTDNIQRFADITSDPQTDTFTLPATATTTIGSLVIDNRGTWRVNSIDNEGALRATAFFTVHDPAVTLADLAVSQGISIPDSENATAGAFITLPTRLPPIRLFRRCRKSQGRLLAVRIPVRVPSVRSLALSRV